MAHGPHGSYTKRCRLPALKTFPDYLNALGRAGAKPFYEYGVLRSLGRQAVNRLAPAFDYLHTYPASAVKSSRTPQDGLETKLLRTGSANAIFAHINCHQLLGSFMLPTELEVCSTVR